MSKTTAPRTPGSARAHSGPPRRPRPAHYFWLCTSTSVIAFLGFSFTYFGPMLEGAYPEVSPTVHLHGWSFFLWYLLLPVQAGLVPARRISVHRTLGLASIALATVMIGTGLVVIGVQMELASHPEGSPFWQFLGPGVFVTLGLFGLFYALAIRFRRRRELHKRFILLASTGALGAAGFRVLAQFMGFGPAAGVGGILLPNLVVVAAILVELGRGEGIHPVYRWGLPLSALAEGGAILLTNTGPGRVLSGALAWLGTALGGLY
mgnify:FL=1